jgi:hypothetical protein
MWRWSIVFGVLVGLLLAGLQPGWAQGVFGSTIPPGDEGTQACREVQLAVQGKVGDETNPPYKNHGQYVQAAAHEANPALKAGEITEGCHSCIVSQFARSIPIANQESCGPDLCEVSGGPGWQNVIISGFGTSVTTSDTTPQACCQACVVNLACAQWALSAGVCFHNVGVVCAGSPIPFPDGGMIRCPAP